VIILLHSQNVEKYDLSSLRTLMSGAAPLGGDTQEAFLKKFPWIKLTQVSQVDSEMLTTF